MIDHRFHKAIIGAQGAGIRDIRDKFTSVVISFPDPSRQSDVVSLRGPKDDVDRCYKYLHQMAQDMVFVADLHVAEWTSTVLTVIFFISVLQDAPM